MAEVEVDPTEKTPLLGGGDDDDDAGAGPSGLNPGVKAAGEILRNPFDNIVGEQVKEKTKIKRIYTIHNKGYESDGDLETGAGANLNRDTIYDGLLTRRGSLADDLALLTAAEREMKRREEEYDDLIKDIRKQNPRFDVSKLKVRVDEYGWKFLSLIETGKKKFAEFQLLDNGEVKTNEKGTNHQN